MKKRKKSDEKKTIQWPSYLKLILILLKLSEKENYVL